MLPSSTPVSRQETIIILGALTNFVLGYFRFMPAFIMTMVCMVPFYVSRYIFFDEEASELKVQCALLMVNVAFALVFVHLIVTKVGMIYVNEAVIKEGSD